MMGTHACHAHAHAHHSIISQSQAQASFPRPLAWSAQFVRETEKEKENEKILREKARAAYEKWARKWEAGEVKLARLIRSVYAQSAWSAGGSWGWVEQETIGGSLANSPSKQKNSENCPRTAGRREVQELREESEVEEGSKRRS